MGDENSEEKKPGDAKWSLDITGMKSANKIEMPNLPKPLNMEEKKYLLAVERGDMANVRRILQRAHRRKTMDMNCVDPLGRGAVSISIDGENLEMLELLIVMGVNPKDALLQAIDVEFVEAVELLLEYEELMHKDGEPYSWEKVDFSTGSFSPDMTPITLAAHRNNYEIIKILLDRGATLPMPHDVRCGCDICIRDSSQDSLRHSQSRVNQYKALSSPSLIALSSNDPILTAFQLSWELRNLAFTEQESKSDYLELRRQVQSFAVDLLDQIRSSSELAIILNHDPESPPYEDGERMHLNRLELAIQMKQKKFVAHPNVQQLLASLWYDGLPGFRRKTGLGKLAEVVQVAALFPFYCMWYMIAPESNKGRLIRKPFMKFLINASSYLFFLLLLILVSQHAEQYVVLFFGTDTMKKNLAEENLKQRGQAPTILEWAVVLYVLGFICEEISEMFHGGLEEYLRDLWNIIDFIRNSLYLMVILLRGFAYIQQSSEISRDPASAFIPREEWNDFDPHLISEGLFAAANIFSALKLVHLFSINPHLGPLQISLGRMVIDIIKFFSIYSLVLFAFACGLNQLLGYFADLERKKCYTLPGGLPDWENAGDACAKWRRFGNLFESSQSLFWASFGMVGIDSFELTGIKTYTRFWGLLMFGSYCVMNIIVLLNLLIAMMSNSFSAIVEHADTEWKFARTRLWMSCFEEGSTLPPPFNIFPNAKLFMKLCGKRTQSGMTRHNSKRRSKQEKERDYRYTAVIRSLVWRYVCHQHKMADENPVTEDDINEVKGEISAMKYDLVEVLSKNGMDTSSVAARDKAVLGKKMKIWERRLMKDFHLSPVSAEEEVEKLMQDKDENEDPLDRFRRVARLAVLKSCAYKWSETIDAACQVSKIGRSFNRTSLKNQESLKRAMQEAQKLVLHSPIKEQGELSPIRAPEVVGGTLQDLLRDMKQETKHLRTGKYTGENSIFLSVNNLRSVLPPSPVPTVSQKVSEQRPANVKKRAPMPDDPKNPTITFAPPTPLMPRAPANHYSPASSDSNVIEFPSTEHLIDTCPETSPRRRVAPKKKGGWI